MPREPIWTPSDAAAVFACADKFVEAKKFPTMCRAMVAAQKEVLPAEKQMSERTIMANAVSIRKRYTGFIEAAKREAKKLATISDGNVKAGGYASLPPTVDENPARKPVWASGSFNRLNSVRATAPVAPPATVADYTTAIFAEVQSVIKSTVAEMVVRYEEMLRAQAAIEIQQRVDEALKSVVVNVRADVEAEFERRLKAATPKVTANKLFRVLIVGLLPAQKTEVEKMFGDSLKLEFIYTDDSHNRLKALKDNMDFILMMRKFITHNHTEIVNKANHKGFIMINGGMTELNDSLLEIACR